MLYESSCIITVSGKITKQGVKTYNNGRKCISITVTDKDKNDEFKNAWVNCYFYPERINRIEHLLKPNRVISVTGELYFSTFKEDHNNNIDIKGLSLQLLDNPFKDVGKDYDNKKNEEFKNNIKTLLEEDDGIPF